MTIFTDLFASTTGGTSRAAQAAARQPARTRPHELADLAQARKPEPQPAPPSEEPPPVPLEAVALVFGEADLARACAAAALAARTAALDEETLRRRAAEERLQASLRAGLAFLEAEADARAERSAKLVHELTSTVLDAVLIDDPTVRGALIVAVLRRCLADMPDTRELVLRAAPEECGRITDMLLPLLGDPAAAAATRVEADAGLAPGEVRLSWRDSWIELDLPSWLATVKERLASALSDGSHG